MKTLMLSLSLALASCGTDHAAQPDAGGDAATPALAPCLDEPHRLPTAPTAQLPCTLLPPDFVARTP